VGETRNGRRIDRIVATNTYDLLEVEVRQVGGSDHRAVVATFGLQEEFGWRRWRLSQAAIKDEIWLEQLKKDLQQIDTSDITCWWSLAFEVITRKGSMML